jgi:hypothetical protein
LFQVSDEPPFSTPALACPEVTPSKNSSILLLDTRRGDVGNSPNFAELSAQPVTPKITVSDIPKRTISDAPSAVPKAAVNSDRAAIRTNGAFPPAAAAPTSPIASRDAFRSAALSAVRVRCGIPLRKLRNAVLSAALAVGGSLLVREENLKLDLPLQRIRLAPDKGNRKIWVCTDTEYPDG